MTCREANTCISLPIGKPGIFVHCHTSTTSFLPDRAATSRGGQVDAIVIHGNFWLEINTGMKLWKTRASD